MFETAELGAKASKEEYESEAPKLRAALLQAQEELRDSPYACVVLLSGVEGAGKSETVNLLLEWMDPRGIRAHAMRDLTGEERERPAMWRFWNVLPPTGRTAALFGTWYTHPIVDRALGRGSEAVFDQQLDRIVEFEEMLHREHTIVVKLWMHLSKQAQRARLQALEKDKLTRFRVSKRDWRYFRRYDKFRAVSEHAIRKTSTGAVPWHIIEAEDPRHRALTAARTLLSALRARLDGPKEAPPQKEPQPGKLSRAARQKKTLLSALDLSRKLDDKSYEAKSAKLQARIALRTRDLSAKGRSVILVFEGPDAAGKGGAIRRVTRAIDPGTYDVISVAAPTDEERARPYLWRFWRHLPREGHVTIYDRSWYGRVLVERVEGFCAIEDWKRAYAEINSFEEQLADFGTIVLKFWLAISPEEQLRRFKAREEIAYKQYKITEEDWRNRARWDAYETAALEMFEKTSTSQAPWILVEGNDKQYARVKVMKAVADALKHR
jgi:polyphosphate:AMP phosphotransferase